MFKSKSFRFRWINAQCFEFQLNNGKTLLTDPCYKCKESFGKKCPPGFTTKDLEGCDYLFVNHSHGDHISNLQEVYDRFHPTIIAPSPICFQLAKEHEFILTDIYPVDYNQTYYFDGFILETFHGQHHRYDATYQNIAEKFKEKYPGSQELNALGSIFNMNFILTTDQGFRVAFIGGNDDGMLQRMAGTKKPNIVLRNKMASSAVKEGVSEAFADWVNKADIQLLVPMHYETWLTEDPAFARKVFTDMNDILEKSHAVARAACIERTKWYTVNITIEED